MPAVFPGAVKTYTNKIDGTSVVLAADINSVQEEVNAIETAVGINPATTSLGGSVGTFSLTPPSSVAGRLANLEAGLTSDISSSSFNGATDGSHIGYTLLYTGNFTSAPGALSISGTSYAKIVVVVRITSGAASSVTLNVNNASTIKYGYFTYTTAVPTAGGGSLTAGSFPISNVATPANNDTITAEIFNVSGTGAKTCTWINGSGFGSGIATAGGSITSAVTTLTLASGGAYPTTATYSIYGVK